MDAPGICPGCLQSYVFFCLLTSATEPSLAEEARAMLQGVGPRFDFHINKTLCDLRFVIISKRSTLVKGYFRTQEIFDIIIDFPESIGALQDLRVQ